MKANGVVVKIAPSKKNKKLTVVKLEEPDVEVLRLADEVEYEVSVNLPQRSFIGVQVGLSVQCQRSSKGQCSSIEGLAKKEGKDVLDAVCRGKAFHRGADLVIRLSHIITSRTRPMQENGFTSRLTFTSTSSIQRNRWMRTTVSGLKWRSNVASS